MTQVTPSEKKLRAVLDSREKDLIRSINVTIRAIHLELSERQRSRKRRKN